MKCKLVINKDSGNFDKLDIERLMRDLGCSTFVMFDSNSDWSADGFDTVVVCGGDGTLHNALEKCCGKKLIYVPCGTLNETALTEKTISTLGCVNGKPFGYVCATGSFTEIGYSAKNSHKKKWKGFAYLPLVFSCYRSQEIGAKLNVDGQQFVGNYTLLMVLKSHRCFGLPFNSDYKKTKKTYLLAVKSFGKNTLKNKVKMFFPFFRIFFCKPKPQVNPRWLLLPFENLTISLDKPQTFCFDGEKREMSGLLHFSTLTLENPVSVVEAPLLSVSKRQILLKKQHNNGWFFQ